MKAVSTLLEGKVLCNDSSLSRKTQSVGKGDSAPLSKQDEWTYAGMPTEVAMLTSGIKLGMDLRALKDAKPRVASVPFESEHKFMATVHQEGDKTVMYVKGAPDRLLPICSHQVGQDNLDVNKPVQPAFWNEQQEQLSSQGLRVLALCRAEVPAGMDISEISPTWLRAQQPFLSMVCLIAILDPPRPEAITAIKVAQEAGIVVKMITGDHAMTALAIGRMLGIAQDKVYTGPELDQMSDEELDKIVLDCNIYARASPENKINIVRSLQRCGQISSMTGDGVNDAPALKAANIGVAMGITGTDVSKEASKMVLADDNFATIVAAVKEGRRVWDNLRKILVFNFPVNFAQGLSVFWALVIGMDNVPLTAIQVIVAYKLLQ